MEYKKAEKGYRREDNRRKNNFLKERSEKCNSFKTNDSKLISAFECTNSVNVESRKQLKFSREELNRNGNNKISRIAYSGEIIKEANFDYEEEWDIDGIPELLNELDADIEKSLKNIQNSKYDSLKIALSNKQDIVEALQSKHCDIEKGANNLNSSKKATSDKFSKNKISLEKNISSSTFTGFSKGGHLISNCNSLAVCSTTLNKAIGRQFKKTKNLEEQVRTVSMSSQAGNNGSTGSNICGTGLNIACGQSISTSNSTNKPNNKMSIDHQATLDKGLKMKIKRTKPGTKSSEAKHEIVKASEQLQNGINGSGNSVCLKTQDDISGLLSNQSTTSNSQNSNVTLGISNSLSNSNLNVNKKMLGASSNQTNMSTATGSILNSISSAVNNVSSGLSQGNKRASSGHRRDKTKEKSSHSNRSIIEKNSTLVTDKESMETSLCQCKTTEASVTNCSSNSCIRKTENNSLTQRLPAKNTCSTASAVPPGVFTPSADASASDVSSAISTPVNTQTISSGCDANTPGPPNKEASNNGTNVKISSHIAAQLAAAAASNSSANGPTSSSSTFPSNELQLSSSNVQPKAAKLLSPTKISAVVNHTISTIAPNQKISTVSSPFKGNEKLNISSLNNESLDSPPSKRVKHSENNTISSISKEMVDICIGTSVGTITEPDCLGPCEPGTSVTLEGIVWHETEGGVLVVNVTWRGKTYVGTLLDCTRHDWAPPRFCDSPTEDLDARTSKGRGKRSRATITPDLSNFTETRSSIYFSHSHVHSKLRNGSTKGGRGSSRNTNVPPVDKVCGGASACSGNSSSTPSTSPTAFLSPRLDKQKSKDESTLPANGDSETANTSSLNVSGSPISSSIAGGVSTQPQSLVNPVTGLNIQISAKNPKTPSPCAISPVLLECPENDCSKKYKHVNGLRYHQSHAHGNTSLIDEDSMAETEDHITPQPSPSSSTPTPSLTPNPTDIVPNNQIATSSQSSEIAVECSKMKINEEDTPQQLEISDKNFTSEIVLPLSCENILTSTASSSTTPIVVCGAENIAATTIHNEQQKQFHDMVESSKSNVVLMEANNQGILHTSTAKAGVLHFVKEESKINKSSSLLSTKPSNESLIQQESIESESTKKYVPDHPDSNNTSFCSDSLEETGQLQQNHLSIVTNKNLPDISAAAKPKKERKSPSINEYSSVRVNSCNLSSREDVQSPAYSDISDDSTPVNEADHIDKVEVSKNPDIIKNSQDMGLSASTTCGSSHTNISPTISNYGVYQFYQQQQYMVQPSVEPSTKNILNTNMGSTNISPSLVQQQTISEFNSKKESPLETIAKANLNQPHPNQLCPEISKDSTRTVCATGSHLNSDLSNVSSAAINSTTPKSVSHFYAFNYMPSNYPFNVDHNFASSSSIATTEDNNAKPNRLSGIPSPNEQSQHSLNQTIYKEDRPKEEMTSTDNVTNLQISTKQLLKSDLMTKPECIKQEPPCTPLSQIPHHMQNKDHQGMSAYANMYQRHPLALPSPQLSREEELRRYYIFSDQQRRQNNSSHNAISQQNIPGNQQCKDDSTSCQQYPSHNQQQIKMKGSAPINIIKTANSSNSSKESPKHKQEEDIKVIKQEGQKPTMETQGPPPPPTSQYFLHPSYITSAPFGFDPNHPMYRNVLMPATSPYNTPPYHLPMPRYHAPEDLSRNTGTKALDALHHAASQYYTTHKIHELSERALKSPNSSNVSGTIKISGSSPSIGATPHSSIGHHAVQNQSSTHNLTPQTIGIANKQEISGQKVLGSGPGGVGTPPNEAQKQQTSVNSTVASGCGSGNGSVNNATSIGSGSTSDSRSPPPQRHVHTHHHTHVGLGYPMYPAPYGAAVLASQQAAAVAVINPFPPGPNK